MTVTDTTPASSNGVNVEALLGARQALTDTPEAAAFTWRATCDWVRGTHARTEVQGVFGLGQEHERDGHAVDVVRRPQLVH